MTRDLVPTVGIVGGGFAGVLTAICLLRAAADRLRVVVIEATGRPSRGVAYGTPHASHLLNVPACRMSALAQEPDHFVRWLQERGHSADPQSFAPRRVYGDHLESILEQERSRKPESLQIVRGEVINLEKAAQSGGIRLVLADSSTLDADRVVLALGNFSAANPPISQDSVFDSPRFIRDTWAPGALETIRPDDDVLFIGAGLTMVDVLMHRLEAAHPGKHVAISRHGLLPQPHAPARALPGCAIARPFPTTARGLLRSVRVALAAEGAEWRAVIDSLRADTAALWQALPLAEQSRFLRHLRCYWDVHRHRVPPAAHTRLRAAIESEKFCVIAGRIRHMRLAGAKVSITVKPRGQGQPRELLVDRVVNCTGPNADYRRLDSPLVRNLRESGEIQPDTLGLGIATTADWEVVDARGRASKLLFTLGGACRPRLWESIAVPELRHQAVGVAECVIRSLRSAG